MVVGINFGTRCKFSLWS